MNADFRSSNASWVLVFQDKDLGLVKTSNGQLAEILDEPTIEVCETEKPL